MEAALRSYSGDDPLYPWDEYIRWTEQAFPNGGKDSNLEVLLEKCLRQFKGEDRYQNDARYVSCWIKLATNFVTDPLEVFQFMRDQSIGVTLSIFYEAWAWELEQKGNSKRADTVYREGLTCHAQPKDRLETAHRDFQSRVARATMTMIQDGGPDSRTQTEEREQLGDLRAKGRHHKVSNQRIGAAKQASKGGISVAMPPRQVDESFSVFCDSDQPQAASTAASLPAPTGEWESVPVRHEAQKENVQDARPWAGQKVHQNRSAGISVSEVASVTQPSFKVHVDETAPETTAPRMFPEVGNRVLNAHKPEKPSNLLQSITQQPVTDDKTKAMYCKHLIYNGANEMSFEELRAIKYNSRKEAQRLAEERAELEKRRVAYEAMLHQQQESMEQQLHQQRLIHQQQLEEQKAAQQHLQQQIMEQMQQQQQQMLHQLQQQLQQQLHHEPAATATQQEQPLNLEKRPQSALPLQHSKALPTVSDMRPDNELRDPTVTRKLVYEDTGNQATWMNTSATSVPHLPTPSVFLADRSLLNSSQITPLSTTTALPPQNTNISQVRTPMDRTAPTRIENVAPTPIERTAPTPIERAVPTPGSSHSRNTSGLSLSRTTPTTPGGLTRPSPTMHTKEAMSVVMAMLNNPLADDDDDGIWGEKFQMPRDQRDNDFEALFSNKNSDSTKPQPLAIFQSSSEPNTNMEKPTVKRAFTIFSDLDAPSSADSIGGQNYQDEFDCLDNQENMPPKDYVQPVSDRRQKLGILQPAQGIPFMSLEDQERLATERRHLPDEDGMEGIVPLPDEPPNLPSYSMGHRAINETILNAQDAAHDSAFKAASRMASTPFTSSGVLAFPPLSSIKPPAATNDQGRDLLVLGEGSLVGRPAPLATRSDMGGSFETAECTVNPDVQQILSPIMERSNEDARSSTSSSSNSTGASHLCSTTHAAGVSSASHVDLASSQAVSSSNATHHSIIQDVNSTSYIDMGKSSNSRTTSKADISTSSARLLKTGENLRNAQQVVGNTPSLSTSANNSAAHRNLSSTHVGPFSASKSSSFAIYSDVKTPKSSFTEAANRSLSTTARVGPPSTSPELNEFESLDESHINVRRGYTNHQNRADLSDTLHSRANHTLPFNEDEFLNVSNFAIGTTESFAVFQDDTSDIFSRDGPHHQLGSSLLSMSQTKPLGKVFNNSRSFHASTANKIFGDCIDEQQNKLGAEKSTGAHHSFKIFDENSAVADSVTETTAPKSFHSASQNEFQVLSSNPYKVLAAHPQTPKEPELTANNPTDISVHLGTSLMSKMHLNEAKTSVLEASLHVNASLPELSKVPDTSSSDQMSSTVSTESIDPFSESVRAHLLESLDRPLSDYEGYSECDYPIPAFTVSEAVCLGDKLYNIVKLIGKGAFANVYQASVLSLHTEDHTEDLSSESSAVALKVQKPACPWEFYITQTLHQRLRSLQYPVDVTSSLMLAEGMHMFPDGSCLVTHCHRNVTLLDAVNAYNQEKSLMPEPLLLLFTIEILHLVEQMHACGIIHGDIKPDNFLFFPPNDNDETISVSKLITSTKHVKLIDFGRSIDMQLFPPGTDFTASSDTESFMCPEMLRGKPWTYQTDLFGMAGTVHCLMFGTYMKVYEEKGHWKHTSKIKRSFMAKWKEFFDTLLNIPSCDALPSLSALRQDLEETLSGSQGNLGAKMDKLASLVFK